jgi:hypothetical protein
MRLTFPEVPSDQLLQLLLLYSTQIMKLFIVRNGSKHDNFLTTRRCHWHLPLHNSLQYYRQVPEFRVFARLAMYRTVYYTIYCAAYSAYSPKHVQIDVNITKVNTDLSLYAENLMKFLDFFRQEFTAYAKKALDRLTRSIVQTSSAIQSSKWLAGAKVIYEVVRTKRAAQGLETKPFMEWAGLDQEVDRLVAGQFQTD